MVRQKNNPVTNNAFFKNVLVTNGYAYLWFLSLPRIGLTNSMKANF